MAVQGNLKDISLSSLISINCNEMNRARLSIVKSGQQALVYFDEGNIVHAELDTREGEEVLFELLSWREGDFSLEQGIGPPKQSVHTPWSGLLLEGMHRIDEAKIDALPEVDAAALDFTKTDRAVKALAALKRVAGVNAAVLCSSEGEWTHTQDVGGLAAWPEVGSFLIRYVQKIGEDLLWGAVKTMIISESNDRWLILPYASGFLMLNCSLRASTTELIQAVQHIQQRYPLQEEA